MKEVTCFDDLEFGQHPNRREGCVSAVHELPNGLTISIIGGGMFYGNGESTFEFACWETGSKTWLNLSDITSFGGDEVLGWLGKDEVTQVIKFLLDYQIENPDEEIEDND
jgi:hypothetical protein